MPPRRLVWTEGAVEQLEEYLERRTDKVGVVDCIAQQLLTVAQDAESITQAWDGPFDSLRRHHFICKDGTVSLHIHAELVLTDDSVIVYGCGTTPL